ncbi:PadR family transcriptional regulator [Roseibium aggregatum]|nr:PadR family transcriptional regulator [Roseibium aggregatum]
MGHMKRHGRGGRRNRLFDYGELRLLMLAMIAEKPRHGYDIIKALDERFEGNYTPSPGVVYPTLAWLEDMGYAVIEPDENNRKLSSITPEGEAFLTANQASVEDLLSRKAPAVKASDVPEDILLAMKSLKSALYDRLEEGDAGEAQIKEIAAIIDEAARKLAEQA